MSIKTGEKYQVVGSGLTYYGLSSAVVEVNVLGARWIQAKLINYIADNKTRLRRSLAQADYLLFEESELVLLVESEKEIEWE